MTASSHEDLGNDILLVAGLVLCVLGFLMHYWYWCFIGVLFVLSGLEIFKPERDSVPKDERERPGGT